MALSISCPEKIGRHGNLTTINVYLITIKLVLAVMAKRPIFTPKHDTFPFVEEISLDFEWSAGYAVTQAQKSILSLHKAAAQKGISPVLEISSKSPDALGISLSAFNLMLQVEKSRQLSVECAFQGSKVFEKGGPFTDLYGKSSREAKTDERLKNSGEVIAFNFMGEDFPIQPTTAFYDWLYMMALLNNQKYAQELFLYQGFSDIAFNPEKSINCQARSAALFVALSKNGKNNVGEIVKNKNMYIDLVIGKEMKQKPSVQLSLNL